MANTYTWKINKLDVKKEQNGLRNIVYDVYYSFEASSSELDFNGEPYKVKINRVCSLQDPSVEDYVEFDDLTKDQVVAWIENSIDVDNLKFFLDNMLSEKINPSVESKTAPWLE